MHRKHIRRWHKLLSVSGIIVAVFGALLAPTANAQVGGPTPDGIYGPAFSNQATQTVYLDFPTNVVGLENKDLYFTGTATGCLLNQIPNVTAFSFAVQVSGCSDGKYRLNLKAESISYTNGKTGPTTDFVGAETWLNRSPLSVSFVNPPTAVSTSDIEWLVEINHPINPSELYSFELLGSGCTLVSNTTVVNTVLVKVTGCRSGSTAALVIWEDAFTNPSGGTGPTTKVFSPNVSVTYEVAPVATATPTPTPTATATPTPTPTATPTSQPAPSSAPTAESTVAIVAPPPPPAEPPTPPQPPVIEQQPVAQPVVQAPVIDVPEQAVVPVESISESLAQIVETREALVLSPAEPIEAPVVLPVRPAPVVRQISQRAESSINWQPLGYLAIGLSGVSGAVGATLMLKRFLRVRRYRFS